MDEIPPGNSGTVASRKNGYTLNAMPARGTGEVKTVHPYAWLWEPLEDDPTFVLRAMFGTKAAYVAGRLTLCFSAQAEPWRGVLVCTERLHQESLIREFPALAPHPILPKWLYLPDAAASFEATAQRLVKLVRQRDPRIGVEPSARSKEKRPRPRVRSRAQKPRGTRIKKA